RTPQQFLQKLFARMPDADRSPEPAQSGNVSQDLEVVRRRFAEPDPRVNRHPLAGNSLLFECDKPRLEIAADFADDISVPGVVLHCPGSALHVPANDAGPALRAD